MTEPFSDSHDNPLLQTEGLPRFDLIQPEHVVPAVQHLLAQAEADLKRLEQDAAATWAGVVEPLEAIDACFERTWKPVTHLFGVKNSTELREAYESVLGDVVQFGMRLKQSRPIYRALKAIRDGDEWRALTETQRRIIDAQIRHAELAGIGLQGVKQERFNQIAQELSQLSTDFSNHVLDATKAFSLVLTDKAEIDGLPESLLQLAAQSFNEAREVGEPDAGGESVVATAETGPWRITLEVPCLQPFLQHSRRRDLRETVYRAFVTRASRGETDNVPLIGRILKLRREQAALLGFRSHAEVSLAEKMAANVGVIDEMFETLRSAAWEPAHADLQDLQQLAAESGVTDPLRHWDIGFWAERLREQRFDYTDEQLRPYFPLSRVLEGLFQLVHRLFGITVTPADGEASLWHEDVRFFTIRDEGGEPIASFYLDPYSRPEDKRGGAWMDECLTRRRSGDRLQLPVAHLVCNSTPPIGDRPSLMTFREVETLFHEFGHGLQHMLTVIDYPDASGINGVEWDAVELPSQFMEVSGHYETGEPLPEDLFEKLKAARTFRSGSDMLRQLLFGMTDMCLHHDFDPDGDESVFDVQRRIGEKTSVLPMLPEDRSLCAFQHIFAGGYAAGYYSYKWAEVLSADAFSAFEECGLENEAAVAAMGRRFRDTILALGGSRHPMDVFKEFRGREPDPKALLRHSGLQ